MLNINVEVIKMAKIIVMIEIKVIKVIVFAAVAITVIILINEKVVIMFNR